MPPPPPSIAGSLPSATGALLEALSRRLPQDPRLALAARVGGASALVTAAAAASLALAGDPLGIANDLALGRAMAGFATKALRHARADDSVADMWAETVSRTAPDKAALVFRDRAVSVRQFDERSNQLAWWLAGQGLAGPRSVVALVAANSPRFVIAWMACSKVR